MRSRPAGGGLAILLVCASVAVPAQAPAAAPKFDSTRAYGHLRDMVEIGPRVSGTPANTKTREYLLSTLKSLGIKATEQPFEGRTPLGPVKMVNVIATLPGTRAERIIIGSHFDTKLFREFRFVGASDGASSTAALLELARALTDRPRPFTIELLFLDGEEAGGTWSAQDSTYRSPDERQGG